MTGTPIAPVGVGSNLGEVTALPGGGFMVVWLQNVSSLFPVPGATDEEFLAVFGRRLAADGTPAGDVFQINETTAGFQTDPEVTVLSNGNVAVAWTDGPNFVDFQVEARAIIIDQNGVPQTDELQLASVTDGDQRIPAIAPTDDGGFMAVWQDARELGGNDDDRFIAQQFDAAGGRVGPEVLLGQDNGANADIKLLLGSDGHFIFTSDRASAYFTDTYVEWYQGIVRPEVTGGGFSGNGWTDGPEDGLIQLADGQIASVRGSGAFGVQMTILDTEVNEFSASEGFHFLQGSLDAPGYYIDVAFNSSDAVDFNPVGVHGPSVTGARMPDGTIAVVWTQVVGGTLEVPEFGVMARLMSADGVALSDITQIAAGPEVQGTGLAAPFAAADEGGNLFIGWSAQTDRAATGAIEIVGGVYSLDVLDQSAQTAGDDLIVGTAGRDALASTTGADVIYAGAGNDTILSGTDDLADMFYGQGGDDVFGLLLGQGAVPQINGGSGFDVIDLSASTRGLEETDYFLRGTNPNMDGLIGTAFDDVFVARALPSGGRVHLDAGDDTFLLDFADTDAELDGGAGFDRLIMDDYGDPEVTGFASSTLTKMGDTYTLQRISDREGFEWGTVTLRGIEQIVWGDRTVTLDATTSLPSGSLASGGPVDTGDPTPGDDNLQGTAGNDSVNLLEGDDSYRGLGGDDTINGWSGDDTLDGGAGADLLIGGHGSDVIHVDNAADRVSESRKWTGTDTVISSVDFRTGNRHIENVELTGDARIGAGNGLRNVITGNDGDNILDGGKNVDTLIGGLGDDRYLIRAPGDNAVEAADGGNDTVLAFRAYALDAHVENLFLQTLRNAAGEGVAGVNGIGNGIANTIIGNPFDNFITGREGNDTLRGQAGADTFVFDRAFGADNIDTIVDFNTNEAMEGDTLRFTQAIAQATARGQLADAQFVAGTAALDANDRFIFDQSAGALWFDVDGAGGADQTLVAMFGRGAVVEAQDIFVV